MPIRPSIPAQKPPRVGAAPKSPRPGRIAPKRPRNQEDVSLRMAIGREGVGIELARSAAVGVRPSPSSRRRFRGFGSPWTCPVGFRGFGIAVARCSRLGSRFRHALSSAMRPLASAVWSAHAHRMCGCGSRPAGASICVTRAVDPEDDPADLRAAPVVAFDVDVIAQESDLLLVVRHARGTGLPAAATAIAIACTSAILGGIARREGAAFLICRGARASRKPSSPKPGRGFRRRTTCAGHRLRFTPMRGSSMASGTRWLRLRRRTRSALAKSRRFFAKGMTRSSTERRKRPERSTSKCSSARRGIAKSLVASSRLTRARRGARRQPWRRWRRPGKRV